MEQQCSFVLCCSRCSAPTQSHASSPGSKLAQADGVVATWSQTTDDVLIKVQVPPATRGRDIKFDLHPKRLSVALDGKPLLAGALTDVGEIKADGETREMHSRHFHLGVIERRMLT